MNLLHPSWHRTHPRTHKDPFVHDMKLLVDVALGIREAWQNFDLWIVVVRNTFDGQWYYGPYDKDPVGKTASKQWAMLLAQDHCVGLATPDPWVKAIHQWHEDVELRRRLPRMLRTPRETAP